MTSEHASVTICAPYTKESTGSLVKKERKSLLKEESVRYTSKTLTLWFIFKERSLDGDPDDPSDCFKGCVWLTGVTSAQSPAPPLVTLGAVGPATTKMPR
jgi:hypothetical protein